VEVNDDVTMLELNHQQTLSPLWNAGASVYVVRDRSSGRGGVSILGQKGTSSPLTQYNGTFRFPLASNNYHMDVAWLGGYFSRNEDMMLDRFY
jgi:hypothetical protein